MHFVHACMHASSSFIHSFIHGCCEEYSIRSAGVHAYIIHTLGRVEPILAIETLRLDSTRLDSTRLDSTRLGTSSRATTTTMANACVDDEDAWYTDTDVEEEDSGSEFDENSPAVRATGKGKKAAATVRHPRGTRRSTATRTSSTTNDANDGEGRRASERATDRNDRSMTRARRRSVRWGTRRMRARRATIRRLRRFIKKRRSWNTFYFDRTRTWGRASEPRKRRGCTTSRPSLWCTSRCRSCRVCTRFSMRFS